MCVCQGSRHSSMQDWLLCGLTCGLHRLGLQHVAGSLGCSALSFSPPPSSSTLLLFFGWLQTCMCLGAGHCSIPFGSASLGPRSPPASGFHFVTSLYVLTDKLLVSGILARGMPRSRAKEFWHESLVQSAKGSGQLAVKVAQFLGSRLCIGKSWQGLQVVVQVCFRGRTWLGYLRNTRALNSSLAFAFFLFLCWSPSRWLVCGACDPAALSCSCRSSL